jgi:predicted transcriptional regulator
MRFFVVDVMRCVTLYDRDKTGDTFMTSTTFSMRLDADVKRRLEERAAQLDRSAAWVAQQAISGYLAHEDELIASVKDILENDDGRRISGEAVMAWMSRWADGHDDPFPEPDIFDETVTRKKSA